MKILFCRLFSRKFNLFSPRFNSGLSVVDDNFPILDGYLDTVSSKYAETFRQNLTFSEKILEEKSKARAGGGERAVKRHTEINKKLLVRQRLQLLLDPSSQFLEIAPLAGCFGLEYGEVPSAGVVTGIGFVRGRRCFVLANDATVKGGTVYPITVKKQLRGQELAQMLRLPCIYIVDSGGAFLPLQRDIFPDRNHGGRVFYNEAVMGSLGVPQIALVCGSCTAGAAYIPTMADDAVIVDRIGSVFLGGPPLVKAALGEEVTGEELGGATLHCGTSGCTDYFASDERAAFAMCRDIVDSLSPENPLSPSTSNSESAVEEPLFSAHELCGINGEGSSFIYCLLSRILDGSRFREFRQSYGSSLVVGYGRLGGRLSGVVAAGGSSIDERSALKACQFVQMCSSRRLPVVFFQNTKHDGWISDSNGYESAKTLKAIASLISAIATSNSWKITVNVGDCFGSDYFALCGRSFNPVFSFMWPNASLGVVRPGSQPPSTPTLDSGEASENFDSDECTALYAASHVWVDDVILPQDTRRVLIQCLQCLPLFETERRAPCSVVRM